MSSSFIVGAEQATAPMLPGTVLRLETKPSPLYPGEASFTQIVRSPLSLSKRKLGHFRLTNLLLPKVLKSTDGRIVNVSSSAHLFATTVEWDDLNAEASGAYGPWSAYGLSKLSNILFTKALQKRIDEKGGECLMVSL